MKIEKWEAKEGEILKHFIDELRDRFGDRILSVYLFGSSAKGTSCEHSDIDVLVVYEGLDERELLRASSEITFDLACKEGLLIEVISMSRKEFEESQGHSPFLWEVLKFGKVIFQRIKGTEWKLNFKDYLRSI